VRKHSQAKHEKNAPLPDSRIPPDVADLVIRDVIDLTGTSAFCRRSAELAALFSDGVDQITPGRFTLKPPFRENFIGSLFAYIYPNARFTPAETIAYALSKHVMWYLGVGEIDRIRGRFIEDLQPAALQPALKGPLECWAGFVDAGGGFSIDSEKNGTPAILAFQEIAGEITSLALEIRGRELSNKNPGFRRTLLQSALKSALQKLNLQQPHPGRPHDSRKAEQIALARDHECRQNQTIAREFCSCGQGRHTRRCLDRLDALANSFYSVQQSRLEKLIKCQDRKNS
jgi:hypothetical protein